MIGLTLYLLKPKQAKPAFLLLAEPEMNSSRLQVGQGDASAEQNRVVSHEVSGTFIKTLARDGWGDREEKKNQTYLTRTNVLSANLSSAHAIQT